MSNFEGEYSSLVKDIPIDSENNSFDKPAIASELTKLDNIVSAGGEVVRTVPKLVRSIP